MFLVVAAGAGATGCARSASAPLHAPPTGTVPPADLQAAAIGGADPGRVAIFQATDAFLPCVRDAGRLMDDFGIENRSVTPSEIEGGELARYRMLIVPGGWAPNYIRDLQGAGERAIREFVRDGGSYLGICAGAYYACDHVIWEGERYEYTLKLFAGAAVGPIPEIAPWPKFALGEIVFEQAWGQRRDAGEGGSAFYFGGPYFEPSNAAEATVLARFRANGKPAAVRTTFGQGQVVLISPHLEIDPKEPWPETPGMLETLSPAKSLRPLLETVIGDLLKKGTAVDVQQTPNGSSQEDKNLK